MGRETRGIDTNGPDWDSMSSVKRLGAIVGCAGDGRER